MNTYQSVAGQFFPESPEEQKEAVRQYLKVAKDNIIDGQIKALIVPHAGWMYSGVVAAAGYKLIKLQITNYKLQINYKLKINNYKFRKDKIILVGPSHREHFLGIKESICDHSVEVQVPFIKEVLPSAEIVPVVYGEISYQDLAAEIISRLDKNCITVVSSDLSHYLPYEEAKKRDAITIKSILELDVIKAEENADACGIMGILALMNIAKEKDWRVKLLDYRNSGDTAGDKDAVVGYGCFAFYCKDEISI